MSNSAPRARSDVGRTARPGGLSMRRPRCLPATIRMLALPGRTGAFPRLRFTFRGTRRAALAELLAQHLALDLLHVAARQLAELEGAVAGADQPVDGPAEMFEIGRAPV